jgi:hypothetical protein
MHAPYIYAYVIGQVSHESSAFVESKGADQKTWFV